MSLSKMSDFRKTKEAQTDFQIISFALNMLSVNVSQDILSETTRKLLIAAVDVGTTEKYAFIRGNEHELFAAIRTDDLRNERMHTTSHIHVSEVLAQIGI